MYIFLSILIVIACVLLIGVVLIQKSKGGGLASDYSGGNQYFGYRKTTDFIEKATWCLAIFICIVSIFASFAIKQPTNKSAIGSAAPAQQTAPAANDAQQPATQVPTAVPAPAKEGDAEKPAPAAAETEKTAPAENTAPSAAETEKEATEAPTDKNPADKK